MEQQQVGLRFQFFCACLFLIYWKLSIKLSFLISTDQALRCFMGVRILNSDAMCKPLGFMHSHQLWATHCVDTR